MLIVFNIIIVIFLLGMAFLWATYGLFSGLLQLLAVILSGVIALALWEPLAFWLLGRMPAYAHGVGLLAPFALSLIITRALFDKLIKMNIHVPRIADQAGGGAMGVLAGVLAFGMLINGANYMPIARGALGWEPVNIQGNELVANEESNLWLNVHKWSGSFFETLSSGAMSPGQDKALAVVRPNFAERAIAYRAPIDSNQMKSAHPDNVKVAGLYAVPATVDGVRALVERSALISFLAPGYKVPDDVAFGAQGMGLVNTILADLNARFDDPEANGRPSELLNIEMIMKVNRELKLGISSPASQDNFQSFLTAAATEMSRSLLLDEGGQPNMFAQQLGEGKSLFIVDTTWKNDKPGTYNPSDNRLRVAISQIRLQVKAGDELKDVAPVGYSVLYSPNTKGRLFTELLTQQRYDAQTLSTDLNMGWAFILPESQQPMRFYARELRFDLTTLMEQGGEESPINTNLGAVAQVMGAPSLPAAKSDEQAGDDNGSQGTGEGAVRVGTSGSVAEISEMLPIRFGGASSTSLESDKSSEPWTLKSGSDDRVQSGQGGQRSTIREIWVASDVRLVRIEMTSKQASSLYGRAIAAAQALRVMQVKDRSGNAYDGIGYALLRQGRVMEVDIRDRAASGGLLASELPTFGDGETMYVYFQVPVGKQIVSFVLGNDEEEFSSPIEVKAK